ncbi:predicted protein [Histoplasma capsulatum G186AR]|uniref:Uncharacterized protein n=1 Tax=Ajellomyces capsulatus (strain G186AR / H82 / ATCC MYA-2454 / RMSCC 2432) TaxID=447093 RepID=C0NE13_AJECG|nr:uncharacterized protein HCBG_02106 [Histoplasma capsulatum G186AR]EEH10461.1 predicted protein [Histoplasma capsulatum G186AR]
MPRNKLQFGSAPHRPWPPSPHPHDSNEAVLNYFRECFAVTYRLDVNSQEIQSLEFSFHGTGAMLYLATEDELCDTIIPCACMTSLLARYTGKMLPLRIRQRKVTQYWIPRCSFRRRVYLQVLQVFVGENWSPNCLGTANMLSLVRAGVPTPKPEFPPPTASPDDVLLFFQRYMLHYYNQQTPITPIDQFEPIHGDELYLRSLEKLIDCVGDNIVGKAIYTDLHWRSKYAAVRACP